MQKLKKNYKLFYNKYLLTFLGFILLMLFFDQNDWLTQRSRQKKLDRIEDNIQFLNGEVVNMETELKGLNSDPLKLETYAREKYFQKRDHEDVFIIKKDTVYAQKN